MFDINFSHPGHRLCCRAYRILRRLLLQCHHCLVAEILLRIHHRLAAVDDMQQFVEHQLMQTGMAISRYISENADNLLLQFEANYTRTPAASASLISTTALPILNSTSTAISNQTSTLNATTVQNVTNSFSSASSEYFNRFILEIHESDGIHDLGIIKWEMASKRIFPPAGPIGTFNDFLFFHRQLVFLSCT